MCLTGLEILGLSLAAAGTGANMAASAEEQAAMEDATKTELLRQKEYQKKASSVFDTSLQQSTPKAAQDQISAGQKQAIDTVAKVQNVPLTSSQAQFTAPDKEAIVRSKGNDQYANLMSERNAANEGFGNFLLQQRLKDMIAGGQLGVISNEAQMSQNVLPYELQAAQHSWDWLNTVGQGLSAAGMLTGLAGAMKAVPGSVGMSPAAAAAKFPGSAPMLYGPPGFGASAFVAPSLVPGMAPLTIGGTTPGWNFLSSAL